MRVLRWKVEGQPRRAEYGPRSKTHFCLRSAAWLNAKEVCTLNAEWASEADAKAGFLLEHLGEKPTAWFHRFHKQRQAATTIFYIFYFGTKALHVKVLAKTNLE